MFSVNLCGGLGNQLFQIFTTLALSFKYSKPFFFLNVHELKSGPTSTGAVCCCCSTQRAQPPEPQAREPFTAAVQHNARAHTPDPQDSDFLEGAD